MSTEWSSSPRLGDPVLPPAAIDKLYAEGTVWGYVGLTPTKNTTGSLSSIVKPRVAGSLAHALCDSGKKVSLLNFTQSPTNVYNFQVMYQVMSASSPLSLTGSGGRPAQAQTLECVETVHSTGTTTCYPTCH
ncbi:unnamed protein product [Chrysodeixis includens]|uniref:Uncharacterized protein n=1 Tax=Chrysodeixis includens TaxID=689277 RepID=A0A9N8PX64_CHRIL|nr:unnamed protein product [Chrysodeixis includens]